AEKRTCAEMAPAPEKEPGKKGGPPSIPHPADILVHRHPVLGRLSLERGRRARRTETQEVPRRIHKGVEGVGFARRRFVTARTLDMLPSQMPVERVAGPLKSNILRQLDRQILLRDRDDAAFPAVDDRD